MRLHFKVNCKARNFEYSPKHDLSVLHILLCLYYSGAVGTQSAREKKEESIPTGVIWIRGQRVMHASMLTLHTIAGDMILSTAERENNRNAFKYLIPSKRPPSMCLSIQDNTTTWVFGSYNILQGRMKGNLWYELKLYR